MSKLEPKDITVTVDGADVKKLDKIVISAMKKKLLVETKRGWKQARQASILSLAVHHGLDSALEALEAEQKE